MLKLENLKNGASFFLPNKDRAILEVSHKYKKRYYFIRYYDIDNYHYSTYCSNSIQDILNELNNN